MKAEIYKNTTAPLTTFVQTWTTSSREDQDKLLGAMRRRIGALTGQPGFVSMTLHRGDDGTHISVYAQWRSVAELRAAVSSPAANAGHDELASLGTPDGGACYGVDDVFGPFSDLQAADAVAAEAALLARAKSRWAQRDFETRMVRVNGVSLHVAEGGHGDPVFSCMGIHSRERSGAMSPQSSKTHRVIIPDLRGMGLSEVARGGYDSGTVAEDLHQLAASMGISRVKVVGHDWGGAAGAVYALRYRVEVTKLALLESALPGCGFEALWDFSERNDAFTFVPFLLMGASDVVRDTTREMIEGHESTFLHRLWNFFTGDPEAAPFAEWAPYVAALARPGLATSSSSFYREAYTTAEQVKTLVADKLAIPVLAIAGEKGIGKNHEALVRAFAKTPTGNLVLVGAGHFLGEERPKEVAAALKDFLVDGPQRLAEAPGVTGLLELICTLPGCRKERGVSTPRKATTESPIA